MNRYPDVEVGVMGDPSLVRSEGRFVMNDRSQTG